jgi:hypothetical protein
MTLGYTDIGGEKHSSDKAISCHTCVHRILGNKSNCDLEDMEDGVVNKCLDGDVIMEHKDWKRYNNFNFSLWKLREDFSEFIDEKEMEL